MYTLDPTALVVWITGLTVLAASGSVLSLVVLVRLSRSLGQSRPTRPVSAPDPAAAYGGMPHQRAA